MIVAVHKHSRYLYNDTNLFLKSCVGQIWPYQSISIDFMKIFNYQLSLCSLILSPVITFVQTVCAEAYIIHYFGIYSTKTFDDITQTTKCYIASL